MQHLATLTEQYLSILIGKQDSKRMEISTRLWKDKEFFFTWLTNVR